MKKTVDVIKALRAKNRELKSEVARLTERESDLLTRDSVLSTENAQLTQQVASLKKQLAAAPSSKRLHEALDALSYPPPRVMTQNSECLELSVIQRVMRIRQ